MPARPDVDGVLNARNRAQGGRGLNHQVAIDMLQPGDVLAVDLFGKKDGGPIVGNNLFYYIVNRNCAGNIGNTSRSGWTKSAKNSPAMVARHGGMSLPCPWVYPHGGLPCRCPDAPLLNS